jgi:arginase
MKTVLLEVRSEIGAGTRGASLGIDALKVAARNKNDRFFAPFDKVVVPDQNHVLDAEDQYPRAHHIDSMVKVYSDVCHNVASVFSAGNYPLVLAADHASAGGTLAGLRKANPNKRIGVIWIDAHLDLNTPYTSNSGNIHGMPLAAAIQDDNQETAYHEVPESTKVFWDEMKNTSGCGASLNGEDLVFIGIRDPDHAEKALVEKYNMPIYLVEDVQKKGATAIANECMTHLKDCDMIYVSLDVDSMDTIISVGTGTPVPGGLMPDEVEGLLRVFLSSSKTQSFEMVEVNPTLDTMNAMANVAFDILKLSTELIESRK